MLSFRKPIEGKQKQQRRQELTSRRGRSSSTAEGGYASLLPTSRSRSSSSFSLLVIAPNCRSKLPRSLQRLRSSKPQETKPWKPERSQEMEKDSREQKARGKVRDLVFSWLGFCYSSPFGRSSAQDDTRLRVSSITSRVEGIERRVVSAAERLVSRAGRERNGTRNEQTDPVGSEGR